MLCEFFRLYMNIYFLNFLPVLLTLNASYSINIFVDNVFQYTTIITCLFVSHFVLLSVSQSVCLFVCLHVFVLLTKINLIKSNILYTKLKVFIYIYYKYCKFFYFAVVLFNSMIVTYRLDKTYIIYHYLFIN